MTILRWLWIICGGVFLNIPTIYANQELPEVKENLHNIRQRIHGAQPEFDRLRGENKLLKREVNNLSERLVIITEKINASQTNIDNYEEELKILDATEKELTVKLQTGKAETAKILSAMGRLSLSPSSPMGTMDNELKEVQAGILLKSLSKGLKKKADLLTQDIHTLSLMRDNIRAKKKQLHTQRITLDADKQKLTILLEQRQKKFVSNNHGLQEKISYMKVLSQKESNIAHLIEQIQKQKERIAKEEQEELVEKKAVTLKKPQKPTEYSKKKIDVASLGENKKKFYGKGGGGVMSLNDFKKQRGHLIMPTPGKVIYGFGNKDLTGQRKQGLTIRSSSRGVVAAPAQGEVIYVGKFRDYGHMIILKPSEKYHILLAGLGKTNVTMGQNVLKGEPVGNMPTGTGNRNLYFEMRKNKRPIDPALWLKRYSQYAQR